MTGLVLDEYFGQLHFWITFIGVNITFFPMHFLGLMGMPRRIPDYPDIFSFWNTVCSFGSYVTLVGALLFIVNVYDALNGNRIARATACLFGLMNALPPTVSQQDDLNAK
jgi:heme/copper-type cytochrome/quinol oxidase subunit 1